MDLLVIIFIDVSDITPKTRQKYIKTLSDKFKKLQNDRVQYSFIPANYTDVKAIPIKCYLDGVIPNAPDNLEILVEELRRLAIAYRIIKD